VNVECSVLIGLVRQDYLCTLCTLLANWCARYKIKTWPSHFLLEKL